MKRSYDPDERNTYEGEEDYSYDEFSDLVDNVDRLLEEDGYAGPGSPSDRNGGTRRFDPVYRDEPPYDAQPHQTPYDRQPPVQPAFYAYNADFQPRNGVRKPTKPRRNGQPASQAEFYARGGKKDWEKEPRTKKKRRHPVLKLLAALLVIILLAVAALWLFAKQPKTEQPIGARKAGVSTILLAGTDVEGLRTDTMILLYLDNRSGEMNLLSLPRDTYTSANMSVPKLNGIYGVAGCGEAGMERLLDYVTECIGYRPDGYILVDMNCFEGLVDAMGGVQFSVPMDMQLTTPDGESIVLAEGEQHLDGKQSMAVVRFRAGYALADLQRIMVQRDFLKAAMDQWVSPTKLLQYPKAVSILASNTTTDLSLRNLVWIGKAVMKAGIGEMQMETLPGEAAMISGGSYYVIWPETTAELINGSFNPYEVNVGKEMIYSPWY